MEEYREGFEICDADAGAMDFDGEARAEIGRFRYR
jgi:hypothetical protein